MARYTAVWSAGAVLLGTIVCSSDTADAQRPPPLTLVADDPRAPSPYWLDDIRNCGPRCLHYFDRHFGGSRSFKDICGLCPPLREGAPLADVAKAAQELGYGVTPFTASSRDLI